MVHASHRDSNGMAEVHTEDTDIIYVLDGSATFVTGGTVVDPVHDFRICAFGKLGRIVSNIAEAPRSTSWQAGLYLDSHGPGRGTAAECKKSGRVV